MSDRLLLLGIDGGTWDVIRPLIDRGELPNLATLIEGGVSSPLRSTLPPQSAPAWVSMMTGQNPGRHGILDFWARDLRKYEDDDAKLNQSTRFAGQTIWDYAGHAGMCVGVVSVPVTYPAWPVNGFLLSGTLLAPDVNERSAYPFELAAEYGLSLNFPDGYRYGASKEDVIREGPAMMLRRRDVVLDLLDRYPCDLLVVVLGETDKAQHDFWRYREPDCPPAERAQYGQVIDDHYRVADRVLGDLLDAFGRDGLVAVVSDHGAGPYPRRDVRFNAWLCEQGLLALHGKSMTWKTVLRRFARGVKRFLPGQVQAILGQKGTSRLVQALRRQYRGTQDIDWRHTQAYRVPMQIPAEGILINLEGRQPEGIVPRSRYERLVEELAARALQLTDLETGETIVAEALSREQVYTGPYAEIYTPDLVLVMNGGYKGGWGNVGSVVVPVPEGERAQYRGTHAMDGVLILSGPGVRENVALAGASILDVTPTLLHALDLPVPTNVDGRVLLEAFEHPTPVRTMDPFDAGLPSHSQLAADEEAEILDRLQGLGYLE